jgi:hypothetical protein
MPCRDVMNVTCMCRKQMSLLLCNMTCQLRGATTTTVPLSGSVVIFNRSINAIPVRAPSNTNSNCVLCHSAHIPELDIVVHRYSLPLLCLRPTTQDDVVELQVKPAGDGAGKPQ